MSNKFYKPKNEYGELLVGQPALDKAIADYNAADTKIINDYKEADELLKAELIEKIDNADTEINNTISGLRTELEAADTEIRKSIQALDNKVVAEDTALDNKIDTFKTITVKVIENDSIESYFQQVIQNKEMTLEELKVELGRTVYILKGSDDNISGKNTYEEYVCINPEILDENGRPEMVRLGAVDSILARCEDPSKGSRMGSVELVHNLYTGDDEVWGKYFTRDLEGNHIEEPIPGKAVAPCTLRAFWKADEELRNADIRIVQEYKEADEALKSILESADEQIRNDFRAADTQLKADFEAADAKLTEDINNLKDEDISLSDRINAIKTELMGTTEAADYSGSRIDKIEEAIGISGCPKCGREVCDHDDPAEGQCTIYCRLKDIETDIQDLEGNISNEQERAIECENEIETTLSNALTKETERAVAREDEIEDALANEIKRSTDKENEISTALIVETDRAVARENEIESNLTSGLNDEINRANAAENTLTVDLNSEIARSISKDEELTNSIKDINDTIGNHDSSSTKTIWETIDDNFASSTALTESKFTDAKNYIDANSKAIEGINETIGSRGSSSTKSVWETIDDNFIENNAFTEEKFDEAKGLINTNTGDITAIKTVIGDKNASTINTDTLWGSIKKSADDISNNTANIANNLAQITTNTNSINTTNSRVDAAETTISTHTTDISELKGRLTSAENNITAHSGEITTIKETLGTHSSSLSSHGESLDKAKNDITEINEAIAAINTKLGDTDAAATGSSMWAAINDAKNNITLLQTNKASEKALNDVKGELTAKIEDADKVLTDEITAIKTSLGENKNPEYPNSAWSYIVSHDAAINSDNGILNRLAAIESNVETKAASSDLNASNTRIDELETAKQQIEGNISDINNNITSLSERIDEVNDSLTAQISTLEGQVTTLSTQPGVAVINCGLTSVVENGDVWSNSTTIFASSLINFLPNVNDAKNVNFAVTSVRYTTDDTNAPGEQITPEILYYGGVTNDETNNRSAVITFNDFQRKPQSLIVTITYWEENSVINL